MKHKLFRHALHYCWAAFSLCTGYVLFMKYGFQPVWAESPQALAFIEKTATFFPMIETLKQHPEYTPYWGMFYAFYWWIVSFVLILGFVSTFFPHSVGVEIRIAKELSWTKLLHAILGIGVFCLYVVFVPECGRVFWFNEMSKYVVILEASNWMISSSFYALGLMIGIMRVKLLSSMSDESESIN